MKITNKKAFFDFELLDRLEAGINLLGAEVKAVRQGQVDLTGSHVKLVGSEAYLMNARILPYAYARPDGYDERRTRKLLLHKREILGLRHKLEGAHLTIVPISVYTIGNLIKVEIALAKGKKEYDKRRVIRKRDIARETVRG